MAKGARRGKTLHVVVVGDHRTTGDLIKSGLSSESFACYIGTNQSAVVARAQESAAVWGTSRVDGRPYRLLVGQLNGVAVRLKEYELAAIS